VFLLHSVLACFIQFPKQTLFFIDSIKPFVVMMDMDCHYNQPITAFQFSTINDCFYKPSVVDAA